MVELSVEHVLLFVVAAFLLYHLMGSCLCSYGNGFSVGGQIKCDGYKKYACDAGDRAFFCEWDGNKCVNFQRPAPRPDGPGKCEGCIGTRGCFPDPKCKGQKNNNQCIESMLPDLCRKGSMKCQEKMIKLCANDKLEGVEKCDACIERNKKELDEIANPYECEPAVAGGRASQMTNWCRQNP